MRTVSYRLADLSNVTISLGFVGENEHTRVQFDAKKIFEQYPDAIPALTVRPPNGDAYPAVITMDGDLVIWDVSDSDLAYQGMGEIQLVFTEGETVAKSYIARTRISRSIVPTGEVPTPVQNWIDQANEVLEEVDEAIPTGGTTGQVLAKKSDADRDTEWVDQTGGGGGTSNYNDLSNKPQIGGVTLSGNKTLHDLGAAAEEDIPVVHNVPAGGSANQVLAKASGTDYDLKWVNQSGGGGGGAEIDDTAGEGDTDVVWSADKTWTENEALKEAIVPVEGFMEANDLDGNTGKRNLLLTPYELSDMLDSSFIKSNGTIETTTSYKAYMVSPLIAVQGAGLYGLKVVSGSGSVGILVAGKNGFGFYGSDGETPVSRTDADITSLGNGLYTLNVPSGVSYVRFTIFKNVETYQERTLGYFNQWIFLPDATSEIDDSFFVIATPKANGVINKLYRSDNSYLKLMPGDVVGKKILVFGDSIWGNDRTDGVADFLAEYSGATIYNCAIGGTWICGDRSQASGGPEWTAFDGVNFIHAKMTNTWTDQDQYVGDVASYAEDVLTLLKSVDMSEIDIVILSYGTNDFSNGKTASAIASAYATAISEILTGYPRIRFLLCSPSWRMFDTTDGDVYENANNETLRDVVDAIVEMAKANHVEALDMLHHCPWRALTKAYYLDNDEVHPNTEGNKVYAHVVNGKLFSMY